MVGNKNQRNTENTNSEIGQTNFLFKRTNDVASRNIKILAAFNGNSVTEVVSQNNIPLNYVSELRNTNNSTRLF